MVFEIVSNRPFLVVRNGEDIAKATAAENDLLASALGFEDRRAWINLRCSDGSNVRTCRREGRVKSATVLDSLTYKELYGYGTFAWELAVAALTIGTHTFTAASCHTPITRTVQNCSA